MTDSGVQLYEGHAGERKRKFSWGGAGVEGEEKHLEGIHIRTRIYKHHTQEITKGIKGIKELPPFSLFYPN